MYREDFAILIMSHGRANNVVTVDTIKKCGYTGKWYIVIDNEDNQAEDYIKNFGKEHIIIFDKAKAAKTFDIMDNFPGRGVPTFARNTFHKIAKWLGLTYFLEFEDDYSSFAQRYVNEKGKFATTYVRNFDAICDEMIKFLDLTGALTVAFAQVGDFIGGPGSKVFQDKITRKAMNCFFCRVDRPFQFLGRFNDDVNAYCELGKKGELFFTIADIAMSQPQTQANAGGITEAYKTYGTYVKSFYSVMLCPSCVKIYQVGSAHKRLHHRIDWAHAVPVIISGRYKK